MGRASPQKYLILRAFKMVMAPAFQNLKGLSKIEKPFKNLKGVLKFLKGRLNSLKLHILGRSAALLNLKNP